MSDLPVVLGFDTSDRYCSAALFGPTGLIARRHECIERGQAEMLFPLLERLLTDGNTDWAEINAFGVGVGPGNFTGIRLAVSAARGLSMALGVPAIGINRFDALSVGARNVALVAFPATGGRLYCRLGRDGIPRISDPGAVAVPEDGICVATDAAARLLESQCGISTCAPVLEPGVAVASLAAKRSSRRHPRPVPIYLRAAIEDRQ